MGLGYSVQMLLQRGGTQAQRVGTVVVLHHQYKFTNLHNRFNSEDILHLKFLIVVDISEPRIPEDSRIEIVSPALKKLRWIDDYQFIY